MAERDPAIEVVIEAQAGGVQVRWIGIRDDKVCGEAIGVQRPVREWQSGEQRLKMGATFARAAAV